MSVTPESLAAGKSYLSNMNFVRIVVSIDSDNVTFEERGTKPVPRPWEIKNPVPLAQFAADVTREVPEDFDGEAPAGSVDTQRP